MRDIQTTIMGNATADPTSHPQDDGSVTAKVRVAVTGRYYNSSAQDFTDRKTEFVTVFARKQLARNLLASVRKGQPLIVTGRLNTSEWTGEDNTARHSLNIQAEAIGHDLTFGSTSFARPLRSVDVPDMDPNTGEVLPAGTAVEADTSTGDDEATTVEEGSNDDSYASVF
ncbi:single-stranded DNA-binding protein [Brachybacterium sp. AOP42-C2-15]|jgi:single-strand DNA-binding protein|uniref:single-stranded DNA-binding protein n=1 Tax=unclassified Brachybacterium TaxID=2623841 RepID=UPI003F917EAA